MHLKANISPAELPGPAVIRDDAHLEVLRNLWGGIEAVSAMPGDTPASYEQLGATAEICQELLSKDVWNKYYLGRVINDQDVVPKNLMLKLSAQLTKTADAYEGSEPTIAAAVERLETLFGYERADGKGKGSGKGEGSTPY